MVIIFYYYMVFVTDDGRTTVPTSAAVPVAAVTVCCRRLDRGPRSNFIILCQRENSFKVLRVLFCDSKKINYPKYLGEKINMF